MNNAMKICAVVPTHNHHRVLADVVKHLREHDLPIFIIDDGSDGETRDVVAALHDPENGVTCWRLDENGGKGIAVMTGMILAGASPLEAVQIQLVIVYMLVGSTAVAALTASLLTAGRCIHIAV